LCNQGSVEAKIGSMPEGDYFWPMWINGDMGVIDAYRMCFKKGCGGSGDGRGKEGNGNGEGELPGQPFNKLLRPGQGRGSPRMALRSSGLGHLAPSPDRIAGKKKAAARPQQGACEVV
jgi:hypothetical protein